MNPGRLKRVPFPPQVRYFPLRRTVRIGLRTLHILTAGTFVGGHIFAQPADILMPWFIAAMVTGFLLLLTDLYASCAFLCEMRGIAVLAKLLVLGSVAVFPESALILLVSVVMIGAVSSHLPKRYRHHVMVGKE